MNIHVETLDISSSHQTFSSRFLADSSHGVEVRGGLDAQAKQDILHEEYMPPIGIDPLPFKGLDRSDFFVKVPEKNHADPDLLLQCAQAVRDTSQYLHEFSPEGVSETLMSEQEVAQHLDTYASAAADAALILSTQLENVTFVASPVGGIPPMHAVMERIAQDKGLLSNLHFAPLSKDKPNPEALKLIKNAQGFVHIDDGATLMTDQALLLEQLEENPKWVQHAISEIRRIQKETGTSMGNEQVPYYQQLIEGFANHNMVLAPLYTKNPHFFRMLGDAASARQDAWALAQQGILERSIRVIPENKTAVGSMVRGIPCRDTGVTLTDLAKRKVVDPKVEQILHQGGLSEIDFRLFSNIESLESINHVYDGFLHGLFSDQLRYRILKNQ